MDGKNTLDINKHIFNLMHKAINTINPYFRDDFIIIQSNKLKDNCELVSYMWDVKLLRAYLINSDSKISMQLLHEMIEKLERKRNAENNDLGIMRIFMEYDDE